jgi:hypothetical protein
MFEPFTSQETPLVYITYTSWLMLREKNNATKPNTQNVSVRVLAVIVFIVNNQFYMVKIWRVLLSFSKEETTSFSSQREENFPFSKLKLNIRHSEQYPS